MPSYRYPIKKLPNDFFCPLVPIQIVNSKTKKGLKVYALLDTGASASLMPAHVPIMTGSPLKGVGIEVSMTSGVAGIGMKCYKHNFIIRIISPDFKKVIWESKQLDIDCANHNRTPSLLGYSDVLRHFSLTVNYRGGSFILTL